MKYKQIVITATATHLITLLKINNKQQVFKENMLL